MPKQIVSSTFIKETAWLLIQAALGNPIAFSKAVATDAVVTIVIKDSVHLRVGKVSEIARIDPRAAAAVDAIQWIHRLATSDLMPSEFTAPWRLKMFLAGAVMPLDQEPPSFGSLRRKHKLSAVVYKVQFLHYVDADSTLTGQNPILEVHIA
jgi:hypothetical protein